VGDVHHADIEKLMQSSAPVSLSIRDLVIELVKIRDIVNLISRNTCMYMKLYYFYSNSNNALSMYISGYVRIRK